MPETIQEPEIPELPEEPQLPPGVLCQLEGGIVFKVSILEFQVNLNQPYSSHF